MFGSLWFLYRKLVVISLLLVASIAWQGAVEAASLNLTWTEVSTTIDGFKIQRMAPDGSFVQIGTVGANVRSYTDSSLTSGVSYCYIVRAFNSGGDSDPSNGACGIAKDPLSTSTTSSTTSTTSTSTSSSSTTLTASTSSTSNPLPTVSYIGGKWTDYQVSLKMKSLDQDSIGIIFRYQDQNNYYRFSWASSGNLPPGKARRYQYRWLEKLENGVLTTLAADSVPYKSGQTYQVKILAQGATLKVLINGSQIFSVTDSSFAQGTIALYSYNNQGSVFDDVLVQDLATGAVLLSEDFNDSNFTGWTIIDDQGTTGGPSVWSASTGALVQSSSIGSNTSSKLGTFALYTKGSWTDYRLTFKMQSTDNDCLGAMFRYQDANNYYRFSWCDDGSFRRRLDKLENGVLKVLAEDGVAYAIGQTYQVQILAQDATLNVSVDGKTIFAVTDTSFDGGSIALYSWWNAGSVFDDILVEDLATGTVLLWDNFNDGNLVGWTIIDGKGAIGGPSVWSIKNGALVQSSDIGSNTNSIGTFALY